MHCKSPSQIGYVKNQIIANFSSNILCPFDEIKMAVLPYQPATTKKEKVSKSRVLN